MNPRTAAILNTCQAFGLTKQASVAFARAKHASPIDFGGSYDAKEDAKGVGAHALLGVVPFGSTALGAHLARKAGAPQSSGALRAIMGSTGGGLIGGAAGRGLGNLLGVNDDAIDAISFLSSVVGGGVGGHLATRKYWVPSEAKSEE